MIITATPLRISFLGGNTDFPKYYKKYGGAVLTSTIDKYVYCIIKERFDDEIRINYSIKEIVNNVKDIKHELVREAMKMVGVDKGVEITFLSDIPSEGSGLGSSSAVTIGVLNALHHFKGENPTSKQLAEEAIEIEVKILKKPIGVQDQYAIAFGGFNLIEFGREVYIKKVKPPKTKNLLLLYTGKTRKSSSILSKMKLNKKILDNNKQLAYLGAKYTKDTKYFGCLLDVYWNLKKELNKYVSSRFIDDKYNTAIKYGACGGKIVGAGGGGFLLLVVPSMTRDYFIKKLEMKELPFKFSNGGSKVIFNIK